MTASTLSKLTLMVCLLLGVLAATTTTVCEAKSLVRGATTPQRKRSSRERQLMKDEDVVPPPDEVADEIAAAEEQDPDTTVADKEDKVEEVAETESPTEEPEKEDKTEETEAPTEEPEEEEVDDKNDKNKDEEPLEEVDEITDAPVVVGAEEGPSDVPMSEQPTEGPAENEDEETTAPAVGEDEVYTVELSPFSITLEGPTSLMPEDLHIDGYLLEAMQVTMPNLVNITLVGEVTQNGLIVGADASPEVADDANATRARALRSVPSMHRFLQQLVFYYKGTASFMGPPKYPDDEVNGNMEAALTDTEALTTWVVNSVTFSLGDTGTNATEESPEIVITDVQPNSEVPDSVQKEWEEETAQPSASDGLTTTGIAIVSVAAAVGGLSVLIIVFVGLTGSSGVAGKQGLPEQPLN